MPEQTLPTDRPLLRAAQAAMDRRDLQHADGLFLEHLAQAPDDAAGLGDYGVFCMRTGRAATACYLLYKANALHPGGCDVLTNLGYAHIELQDFECARHSFSAAIALSPDHAPANYGLGLCQRHAGEWPAAAASFAKALAAQPAQADAFPILFRLADACHQAGDDAQARRHFLLAQQIAPNAPALLLAYAKFLREQGEASPAMLLVDRCAQLLPNDPTVILEKIRCLRALGDPEHALRWLDRLEKSSPGLPEGSVERGNLLQAAADTALRERYWLQAIDRWLKDGDLAPAEALLVRLLAANPASAPGLNSLGILENARHRIDAAEASWRKAIEASPSSLDAPANLALLYENTNRLDAAKSIVDSAAQFIRSGEQDNACVELLLTSCKIARRQKDYPRCHEMLRRIDAFGPTDTQRTFAHFERGKIMDLCGDTSGAIAAFAQANALAIVPWQRENPGRNKTLAGVDYMLDLVGKGWLQQWNPIDPLPATADLAFLVGFPRSGTTLLNQVLDSHGAIHAIEEKPLAQKILDAVRGMPKGYPHALVDFDTLDIAYLRAAYFRAAAEHGAAATSNLAPSKLLLDKFPMNITLAGLLHRVFPKARFVLAIRHPCDVVLSCFMQDFELNNTMANFCTLGDAVALYTKTMDLWQAYREQLPLNVHTIRYEDVIDDFDGQVSALCDFLGVPWDDGLRQFADKALDRGRINTPSYEQVSRPIYREARYRWERYREYLAPYLPALQPYIERFGYADSLQAQ